MHLVSVDFEFDPDKSASNQQKHGIDFVEAQRLWLDAGLVILPSKYPMEERLLAIGLIDGRHWTAVFTERGESVRIISVRRARDNEREVYERHEFGQS